MSEQKARKEFERWFSEDGKWPSAVERNANGNYQLCSAHSAWISWRASWLSCQGILDSWDNEKFGIWSVNGGGSVVAEIDGFLFIQTGGPVNGVYERAHLIAAAPELYEALADLVHDFEGHPGFGPARKALAKARGES